MLYNPELASYLIPEIEIVYGKQVDTATWGTFKSTSGDGILTGISLRYVK